MLRVRPIASSAHNRSQPQISRFARCFASRFNAARVKGRIIGKDGKSRALLEELTETQISVYGHTVAYIGHVENLQVAREAILMLVRGAFHKTVWNFLYAYRRKMKKDRGELWYESPEVKPELRKQ